jgi:hypothetical protein
LVPGPLRRWFASQYPDDTPSTHGSAHFGTAAIGARHLALGAPADAFVLGYLRGVSRKSDARFRQDGHVLGGKECLPNPTLALTVEPVERRRARAIRVRQRVPTQPFPDLCRMPLIARRSSTRSLPPRLGSSGLTAAH